MTGRRLADVDPKLIRPALVGLVPYEPGKPVEEVQRELGLERVVKLASNEGPYGPFPAAQEAIALKGRIPSATMGGLKARGNPGGARPTKMRKAP